MNPNLMMMQNQQMYMQQYQMGPPLPLSPLSPLSPAYTASSVSSTTSSPASPLSPYATSYVSPSGSGGHVPLSVSQGSQLVLSGNSASNVVYSADMSFKRIEAMNATAEKLYKIARWAPASLFRKDKLKWTSTGGLFGSPKVCDDRSVNERSTMQLLSDMEVALDTVIAELSMVNKTLTTNVQFMTQFFVCCNRIVALIEVMRSWRPSHGMWEAFVSSGPFNNQTKLAQMAEVVESKIKGKVQAHFSLDMRASGAVTSDVMTGGTTTMDLSGANVVTAASNMVQMNQGVTTGMTSMYTGQPGKPQQQTYSFAPPPKPQTTTHTSTFSMQPAPAMYAQSYSTTTMGALQPPQQQQQQQQYQQPYQQQYQQQYQPQQQQQQQQQPYSSASTNGPEASYYPAGASSEDPYASNSGPEGGYGR